MIQHWWWIIPCECSVFCGIIWPRLGPSLLICWHSNCIFCVSVSELSDEWGTDGTIRRKLGEGGGGEANDKWVGGEGVWVSCILHHDSIFFFFFKGSLLCGIRNASCVRWPVTCPLKLYTLWPLIHCLFSVPFVRPTVCITWSQYAAAWMARDVSCACNLAHHLAPYFQNLFCCMSYEW